MKRYVFLAASIHNMGGAENYLQSKMLWLRNNGWSSDIIYYKDGVAILPELKQCPYRVPEIEYPIFYFSRASRKQVVKQLISIVSDCDYEEVIIESTIVDLATWGEYLCQIIGAKHIIYTLQEDNAITNASIANFLYFKQLRGEIAGINDISVHKLFQSCGYSIPMRESRKLLAYNSSPVAKYVYPLTQVLKEENNDFLVGSIGRLDKPFVVPCLLSFLEYVKFHSDKQFSLLLIGGAPEGNEIVAHIQRLCIQYPNLNLHITGFIYPIPFELIRLCNVFYSSAGSAWVSMAQGIPTISIDGADYLPIGILNYTTKNSLFREDEPIKLLSDYLDDILIKKLYAKTDPINYPTLNYYAHFDFINNSSPTKEYYDMSKLKWEKKQFLHRIIIPIIGPVRFHRIMKVLSR